MTGTDGGAILIDVLILCGARVGRVKKKNKEDKMLKKNNNNITGISKSNR